jgi:transposase-like protein
VRAQFLLSLKEEAGRTVGEIADRLGISVDILYQWRKRYRQQAKITFPGHGKLYLTPEQEHIRQLEKRLKNAEMERDILKKLWPFSAGHRNETQIH